MLPTSIAKMQYFCRTCLKELPPSTSKQQNESLRDLQRDENLVKSLHIATGIDVNITDDYPKQLCLSCYKKIMAFDDFRETALCCALALHELLLEEVFSKNTQNNLQYFCSTCLSQMQALDNTSKQMNSGEVQRWMKEYEELKKCTGVQYWPNGLCEQCCEKLDRFLEFQRIAKCSLMQLDKVLHEKQNNSQDKVLIAGGKNTDKRETKKK
ncbi:uncharacterized protein LOC128856602 [Anastrepha ludens]|uniref:uncharacterized protein LOC128856602 n=1 Tax=Anastrepha ludens TaxID=28586 RepID=UPI0023B1023F|nr:uncharacterized protein LOC128856602 [Anastrepha ludens]